MDIKDDLALELLMEDVWYVEHLNTLLMEGVLFNSPHALPDHRPYGFWIDRHGNFALVDAFQHDETAEEIMKEKKIKRDTSKRKTPRYKQINNLKKKFYRIGKTVLENDDLI